jgi:succinyl-CoA synthetase beta subunit
MNIHEYQSKTLFKQYGIPVSTGIIAKSAEEAIKAKSQLPTVE